MTTRQARRRVSRRELTQIIQRELRADRDISTRALIAKIRAQNVAVSNEAARAITRVARTVTGEITSELVLRNRGAFPTERQFRAAFANLGGEIADRVTGLYVRIAFTARATIPYVLHGNADTVRVAVQGIRQFPVPFNPALLQEQAVRMLGGAAMERLGDLPTDGPVMGEYGRFDADVQIQRMTLV